MRYEDARRLSEDEIAIYRRMHGLLSAEEMRGIRERFNLTQAEFGELLRLGAKHAYGVGVNGVGGNVRTGG